MNKILYLITLLVINSMNYSNAGKSKDNYSCPSVALLLLNSYVLTDINNTPQKNTCCLTKRASDYAEGVRALTHRYWDIWPRGYKARYADAFIKHFAQNDILNIPECRCMQI